jgi:hypothetical protein
MSAEAIVWNAVSAVSAAIVPGTMFMLPVVRALALPDVLPYVTRSGLVSSHFAIFHRSVGAVHVRLGASVERLMGFASLLVMMFRAIALAVAVLRLGWMLAFVLVKFTLLSVGAALFMTSRPAVLSAGKPCSPQ